MQDMNLNNRWMVGLTDLNKIWGVEALLIALVLDNWQLYRAVTYDALLRYV